MPRKQGETVAGGLAHTHTHQTKPSLQFLHAAFSQHSVLVLKLMSHIALTNLTLHPPRHLSVFQLDLDLATSISNLSPKHLSLCLSLAATRYTLSPSLSPPTRYKYRPNPTSPLPYSILQPSPSIFFW